MKFDLKMSNDFDLDICAFGQGSHLDGGAGWKFLREIFGIRFVHAGEIGEVRQEHCAFDYVGECQFLIIQNRFHIQQYPFGLGCDITSDQVAGRWVNGNLSGAKKKIPCAHGMVIRSYGWG